MRIGSLPLPRAELLRLGASLKNKGEQPTEYQRLARMAQILASSINVALIDRGWTAETSPGEDIVLRRDRHVLIPFAELMQCAEGKGRGGRGCRGNRPSLIE